MILAGLMGLLVGLMAGYFLGWRNGHLTGVEYALRLLGTGDVPDDAVTRFTRDTIKRKMSVRDELLADEEYQRQLKEQIDGTTTEVH